MMLWELDVEAWSDSGGVVQAGVCFMGEVGTGSLTNTPWEAGKSAPPTTADPEHQERKSGLYPRGQKPESHSGLPGLTLPPSLPPGHLWTDQAPWGPAGISPFMSPTTSPVWAVIKKC